MIHIDASANRDAGGREVAINLLTVVFAIVAITVIVAIGLTLFDLVKKRLGYAGN